MGKYFSSVSTTSLSMVGQSALATSRNCFPSAETETMALLGKKIQLAGLDHKSQDMLIRLAHFAILAANDTLSAQPINDTEAAKTAAQAAVALLKQKPDDSPNDAKRRAPAASDAGPQNPPPKKKAKRPQPDPGPSDSDSEEEFEVGIPAPLFMINQYDYHLLPR